VSTSRNIATRRIDLRDGIERCSHTLLTKPECHCRACLFEQIATYGRRGEQDPLGLPADVDRAAA
jgi:hypothetical protein